MFTYFKKNYECIMNVTMLHVLPTGLCHDYFHSHGSAENRNECVSLCDSDDSCNWWTFDEEGQICFLFQECTGLTDNCDECISGQKECQASRFYYKY